MNIVELELDKTLADFEIQDWIDNVFSVQYPEIKAKIKYGCSGLCHKNKDDEPVLINKMKSHSETNKKKFFEMVEIIEYLVDSLKQEGIDLSEEGSATDGYKVYQKIKSLIAERDNWS